MAAIGEQFESFNVIWVGASLNKKLFQVWLKDGRTDNSRHAVYKKIKDILKIESNVELFYKNHMQSIKDNSTMKKNEGYKFLQKKAALLN